MSEKENDSLFEILEDDSAYDDMEISLPDEEAESEIGKQMNTKENSGKRPEKSGNIFLRILSVIGVTLLLIVIGLYGVCFVLINGPSSTTRNLFVSSCKETSAMKWLPSLYLSQNEISEILSNRGIIEVSEGTVSDPGMIEIPTTGETGGEEGSETPDIEVIDVKGTTYRGKLLIVKDPARVFVGVVPRFFEGRGMVVADIADRYEALAGINGGEFLDAGSYAYTAMPVGCVISEGELVFGDANKTYNISGFTNENVFVIGKMSAQEAIDMGVRDAVHTEWTTGPFLVLNGEALVVPDTSVYGGGKNPRTAIGQRADGAVLLLVIDGRQANSIGATFEELAYIMIEYGAVNASAMDGGTSTQMYYDGEVINSPYSPTGPRRCPTAFLVK